MRTRRNKSIKRKSSKKTTRKYKEGRKWVTAFDAAQKTLSKTMSLEAAKESLRKQAFNNARKLYGTVIK